MTNLDRIYSSGKIYSPDIESTLIRGVEEQRPWDLEDVITSFLTPESTLLDVGTGAAQKLTRLAPHAHQVVGMDIWTNPALAEKATKNLLASRQDNMRLMHGDAESLPFPEESFDVITHMLAPFYPPEDYRVVKKQGYIVIERTAEDDKSNISDMFGSDEQGRPRGHNREFKTGELAGRYVTDLLAAGFSAVTLHKGAWKTWYSRQGLIKLLQTTPCVRDFDIEKDIDVIDEIEKKFKEKKGIMTEQSRYLIVAKK